MATITIQWIGSVTYAACASYAMLVPGGTSTSHLSSVVSCCLLADGGIGQVSVERWSRARWPCPSQSSVEHTSMWACVGHILPGGVVRRGVRWEPRAYRG